MSRSLLRLEVVLNPDYLIIKMFNRSSQSLRFWELKNSWGYYSFKVHLKKEGSESIYVLKRKPQIWTRNFPSFYTLSPQESREIRFNIKDGSWEIPSSLAQMKDKRIHLRVEMTIEPSPEAEKYGVYIGSVKSDWVMYLPPHEWLFNADSMEK